MSLRTILEHLSTGLHGLTPANAQKGDSFTHARTADRGAKLPETRGFFWEVPQLQTDSAACWPNARHRTVDVNLVVAYRARADLFDAMVTAEEDYRVIVAYLSDPAQYNTATTGLISLMAEGREIIVAGIEAAEADVEEPGALLVFNLPVLYRDV